MTTRSGHCPNMVAEQVSEPRNSTRSPRNKMSVTVNQRTEFSAPTVPRRVRRIGALCTRMGTKRMSCSPTMRLMKVMINEASTLLSVATTGKVPTEGIGSQGTGPLHCFQGSSWTARGRKEDRHGVTLDCTPKESFVNKRHYTFVVAPGTQVFIQNMTTCALQADTSHILNADRQSRCVFREQLSPTSCRVHAKRGIC